MLLSDFGADVVLVERPAESAPGWQGMQRDVLRSGRDRWWGLDPSRVEQLRLAGVLRCVS